MDKKQIVSELFRINNLLENKERLLQSAVGDSFFLLDRFEIEHLMLDILGIPKDNTVEMFNKYGHSQEYLDNEFCRDGLIELIREGDLEELFNYAKQYE